MKTEFDVVRLIQQGRIYHVVMDCVEGTMLAEYIFDAKQIEKSEMFSWFQQMAKQLWCFQNSWQSEAYRLVTPFCMILKDDGQIALLDLYTRHSCRYMDVISKWRIWRVFCNALELDDDIYCFGKTLQYILANIITVPLLSVREEWILKKIVKKCIEKNRKNSYKNFQDVLYDLRRL